MFFSAHPPTHHLQRRPILALSVPLEASSHPPRPSHLCTAPKRVSGTGRGPMSTRDVSRIKPPQLTILPRYIHTYTRRAEANTNGRQGKVGAKAAEGRKVWGTAAQQRNNKKRKGARADRCGPTAHATCHVSMGCAYAHYRVECAPVRSDAQYRSTHARTDDKNPRSSFMSFSVASTQKAGCARSPIRSAQGDAARGGG